VKKGERGGLKVKEGMGKRRDRRQGGNERKWRELGRKGGFEGSGRVRGRGTVSGGNDTRGFPTIKAGGGAC